MAWTIRPRIQALMVLMVLVTMRGKRHLPDRGPTQEERD